MNTKTNALCLGINLLSWIQILAAFFMDGERAIDVQIGCMGTMIVLGVIFAREFFKAVRERKATG
jgi:hypothetical protein